MRKIKLTFINHKNSKDVYGNVYVNIFYEK